MDAAVVVAEWLLAVGVAWVTARLAVVVCHALSVNSLAVAVT